VVCLKSFYLASSGLDRSIIIWNYETGEEVKMIETPSYVSSLSLLNNGHLASANDVGSIQVWNYTSSRLVDTFYTNTRFLCPLKMGNLAYLTWDYKIEVIYSLNAYNNTPSKPKIDPIRFFIIIIDSENLRFIYLNKKKQMQQKKELKNLKELIQAN
jgi:WD40 repeat protein